MNERVTFTGIDGWNRPVFRSVDFPRNFFGSTDVLFGLEATEAEVLEKVAEHDLTFFGHKFGCEPMGTPAKGIEITR